MSIASSPEQKITGSIPARLFLGLYVYNAVLLPTLNLHCLRLYLRKINASEKNQYRNKIPSQQQNERTYICRQWLERFPHCLKVTTYRQHLDISLVP
jgi:hypothetical protein